MYISPVHKSEDIDWPITFENMVEVFEAQIRGWYLEIAALVANGGTDGGGTKHEPIWGAGFAVLMIYLSYFEMIAKYKRGYANLRKEKFHFKEGVKDVYGKGFGVVNVIKGEEVIEGILDILYESARCGLYHVASMGPYITLKGGMPGGLNANVKGDGVRLTIDPHKMVDDLIRHFADYIASLRDSCNEELRRNFVIRFKYDHPGWEYAE